MVALCGAYTYAEISTTLKRSGGEYYYLGEIFHPVVGFMSGWMSTLVGFAGEQHAKRDASADLRDEYQEDAQRPGWPQRWQWRRRIEDGARELVE